MTDDSPFSPRVRKEAKASEPHELTTRLREFGTSVVALCELLDQGRSLTDMDVLFLENHFQVIQMAYLRWKRKYRPVSINPV